MDILVKIGLRPGKRAKFRSPSRAKVARGFKQGNRSTQIIKYHVFSEKLSTFLGIWAPSNSLPRDSLPW